MSNYQEFLNQAKVKSRDDIHRLKILKAVTTYEDQVDLMKNTQFQDWEKARLTASQIKDEVLQKWPDLLEEFEGKIGLPRETAYLYLERIMLNLQNRDVPSLTGPLARKDIATLESNLESLSGDPFIHIYQGFLEAFGLSERIKKRRK